MAVVVSVHKLAEPMEAGQGVASQYVAHDTWQSALVHAGSGCEDVRLRGAGEYDYAIAFQERIRIPDDKMDYYKDLAEMYVGDDVSSRLLRLGVPQVRPRRSG